MLLGQGVAAPETSGDRDAEPEVERVAGDVGDAARDADVAPDCVNTTDAVLLGEHSEKTYKGIEEHMKPIFDMYLDLYLDQDAVLDKINKYGMASLTDRDKRVLEENI